MGILTMPRRFGAGRFLAVVALALAGCGRGDQPELAQVSGTVTLDGEPLVGAIVLFKPDVGRAGSGTIDADGKYEIVYRHGVKGTKVGPTTISFEWPTGYAGGGPAIPAKYGSQSELKEVISPGRNVIDFELESDPEAAPQGPVE
jgi:hypothetical protein